MARSPGDLEIVRQRRDRAMRMRRVGNGTAYMREVKLPTLRLIPICAMDPVISPEPVERLHPTQERGEMYQVEVSQDRESSRRDREDPPQDMRRKRITTRRHPGEVKGSREDERAQIPVGQHLVPGRLANPGTASLI